MFGPFGHIEPFAAVGLILGILAAGCAGRANRQDRNCVNLLGLLDDVRMVGPVADLLSSPEPLIVNDAIASLTRLLLRLPAADTALLNTQQRMRIQSYLAPRMANQHPSFALTILKAWVYVGDESAIPAV